MVVSEETYMKKSLRFASHLGPNYVSSFIRKIKLKAPIYKYSVLETDLLKIFDSNTFVISYNALLSYF